jgi:hypothetical protein
VKASTFLPMRGVQNGGTGLGSDDVAAADVKRFPLSWDDKKVRLKTGACLSPNYSQHDIPFKLFHEGRGKVSGCSELVRRL